MMLRKPFYAYNTAPVYCPCCKQPRAGISKYRIPDQYPYKAMREAFGVTSNKSKWRSKRMTEKRKNAHNELVHRTATRTRFLNRRRF